MKKILLIIFMSACLVSTGCSKKVTKVDNKALSDEFKNAPSWVFNSELKGVTSAVGSAKIGKAGMQFAKTEALAQGRGELARQLSLVVKDLVNNFAEQTGLESTQTIDKLAKQVSKQVSNETLIGSRQKDIWISPSSELYVLVIMDQDMVKNMIRNAVQSSYKNDDARWQQFKAQKGNEELDKEIEKKFNQ